MRATCLEESVTGVDDPACEWPVAVAGERGRRDVVRLIAEGAEEEATE